MQNIVDEINDTYNKITVSEEVKKEVLNKTIFKKEKKKGWYRLGLTFGSIIGLCALSLSVVYADDIREYLEKWRLNYSFTNHDNTILGKEGYSYKKVKDDLYNTGGKGITLTFAEVEENLGFKILKTNNQTSDKVIYTTYLNDDNKTIASIDLWMPDFIKNDDFDLSLDASFITEKADEKYKIGMASDATGEIKKYVAQEKTKFGNEIIFYTISSVKDGFNLNDNNYETIDLLCANFIDDGIKYNIRSNKEITKDQLLAIINSMSY